MKQIYHYFILLLCLLSAACDNDDNSPVKAYIIKSDTTFEAKGGNGTIEVSTRAILSVSSDKDWCKVEAEGNIIHITVPQNIV